MLPDVSGCYLAAFSILYVLRQVAFSLDRHVLHLHLTWPAAAGSARAQAPLRSGEVNPIGPADDEGDRGDVEGLDTSPPARFVLNVTPGNESEPLPPSQVESPSSSASVATCHLQSCPATTSSKVCARSERTPYPVVPVSNVVERVQSHTTASRIPPACERTLLRRLTLSPWRS